VAGGSCFGDTKLSLLSYMGQMLAQNDNGTVAGCGACSTLSFTNNGLFTALYVLRQQCVTPKRGVCGGTTAYVLTSPGDVTPYSARVLIENPDTSGVPSNRLLAAPGVPPAPIVMANAAWSDIPKTIKAWPLWLVIVGSLGGALVFFLLFALCMCSAASMRKKRGDQKQTANVGARWKKKRDDYSSRGDGVLSL
jgi:hypothetical protein